MYCNNKELQECLFENKSVYIRIQVLQDINNENNVFLFVW